MVRVVLDTVVFVRSLFNPFSAWGRLVFGATPPYQLVLSQPVLTEILEVLQRPELVRKFRTAAGRDVPTILAFLARAEVVDLDDIPRVSRDPRDDTFLATAALAGADYLVTEDDDLLVLREHAGVEIVDARAFPRLIAPETA